MSLATTTPTVTAAGTSALPEVTADVLQSRVAKIKGSKELDDDARTAILAVYQNAQAELDRANALNTQAAQFKQATQNAPATLRNVLAELDHPAEMQRPDVPGDAAMTQLETRLAEAQNKLNQVQDELTRFEAEPQRRNDRRLKSIPELIDAANKKLEEIQKQAAAPAPADEAKDMTAARLTLLAARQQALNQEIACATSERESYNAEDELLPKQHDLAERKVATCKQLVDGWQRLVHARRQLEADAKLKNAKEERQNAYPELRGMAEENEQLAQRVSQVNNDVAVATKQSVEFANALSDLEREFQGVTKKVDLGLAQQLGPYLLQFRVDLVRHRRKLEAARLSQSRVDSIRVQWLDLTEQRKKLSDIDHRTEEVLHGVNLPDNPSRRQALKAEVHRLLQSRRELLDSLISAYERYIRAMGPLMAADKELFDAIAWQFDYIEERIFWVPSTAKLSAADLAAGREALRWYFDVRQWQTVGRQFVRGAAASPLVCMAVAALFVALMVVQPRMRSRIRELGHRAARGTADSMVLTLRTLVLTALTAAPWPVLLASLGWILGSPTGGSELSRALAHGLRFTAAALASIEVLRQVCRGHGLATAHFGWPEQGTRLVRKQLRWFLPLALPLTLLGATTHALETDRWQALGRLNFMAAMLVLALLIYRVFRPAGGVLYGFLAHRRGGWADRLHHVLFPLVVASPLALAVLASLGYYYTARQLAWRLQATSWLLVAFLIGGALMLRWLLIVRRRLAMRQARLRRAAVLHESKCGEGAEIPTVDASTDGQLDVSTINLQTRRFVQTALVAGIVAGVWLIWADVLPALSFLNVPLWQTSVHDAEGNTHLEPINVVRLLEAAAAVLLTLVATRNIPGLLEIVLLQRLPLEPATRYAVTTLFRYAITVAGVVVACVTLGITWAKVHWLVAAVSVGLGFGLQEIFANFISGLIILFERPIRVGDVVTVDDVSGVVSRIRIRATMITDFDRKELIVPNKEFITGRVLNWTLSDQINRVVVNVGVAYGSDIERARELLLEVAAQNPYVLKEPGPMATLEGFGDSTLNLVLRCYLPTLDNRMSVVHDLHARIHDVFREEGIDLAFPQLDLHIRTSPVALYQRQAG
ncbi:MAG TPA: mechanosensitive ion channel domain-containing protein [Pirellulales bacterium]|nr:mechanosensitive ion channel domain-containing protein [Pirellulales bacterium]